MRKKVLLQHAELMPQILHEEQMETLLGGSIRDLFAKAATQNVTEAGSKAVLDSADQEMKTAG